MKREFIKKLSLSAPIAAVSLWTGAAFADVILPALIGNNMVIQSGTPVRVWGWAAAGEKVTVQQGNAKEIAVASPEGKWSVSLPAQKAGYVPDLTVTGNNILTVTNILAGDVWVCSGQSNMELGAARAGDAADCMREPENPEIWIFFVPRSLSPVPSDALRPAPANIPLAGSWQVCRAEAVAKDGFWMGFSAVGYRFGRELYEFTHKPVGLIGAYWGGTSVLSWTSWEAMDAEPQLKKYADKAAEFAKNYDQLAITYETKELPNWKAALAKWKLDNHEALAAYQASAKEWEAKSK